MPQDQCLEHFDGYIELVEDYSALFWDPAAPLPSPHVQAILSELLWYMDPHPAKDEGPNSTSLSSDDQDAHAISHSKLYRVAIAMGIVARLNLVTLPSLKRVFVLL